MFCRKCGEKLQATDRFCSRCGEPAGNLENGETPIMPQPPKDLVWNVTGFPKEDKETKTPDLNMEWKEISQDPQESIEDPIEGTNMGELDNEELQKRLDAEIEKINNQNLLREEALARIREKKSLDKTETEKEKDVAVVFPWLEETKPKEDVEEEPNKFAIEAEATPEAPPPPGELENKYAQIFMEDEEEEKEKKKFTIGKLLLILLLILVLAEGAFLGLREAIPDNKYVQVVDKKMAITVETVKKWFEPQAQQEVEKPPAESLEAEKPPDEVKDKPAAETPEAKPEPEPGPYPTNKNIQTIRENPELKYIAGKNYGIGDINNSLPVTESTDEVIGTIVAYDSAWIDYVNKGDKAVIEYTAQGSKAQQNTLSFTKAGKISEVFNLLEIGEVRKGTKGYYVWVREEIAITENNRITTKTYQWIYQVVPSDAGMKIVDYFSY